MKSAKRKLCVRREYIFALKKKDRTITKTNNKILHIVEKFYNYLYECEDRSEISLRDPRENLTETEEIIPMITKKFYKKIDFSPIKKL